MKRQFSLSRRPHRRALSALLLAMPLSGIAFPLAAHAQTASASTPQTLSAKKIVKPLPPEQQARIDKLFALAQQEDLCKDLVYLKVENASADDVVAAIRRTAPDRSLSIEVRGVAPLHANFDVKSVRIGDVLQQVATKAGCDFFVFSRGLLLAPASQLTDEERADIKAKYGGLWSVNKAVVGERNFGWDTESAADATFAYAIAAEIQGGPFSGAIPGVTKLKAGDLSPKAQLMLQQLIDWTHEENVVNTPQDVAIQVITSVPVSLRLSDPTDITIRVEPDSSQPLATTIQWSILRPQLP